MSTIEDLIFNRIPILDVNIFSRYAGGQEVVEGSAVYQIRQSVATWYVAFRNLVIIALAIIIIYTGIKMALSTIANDKANYKKMLIGWISAIIIVFFVHYAIILVLNINQGLVGLFENTAELNVSINEMIRTRADDVRFVIGLPATIIYLVLFIYYIMFLWVYVKRYFTILILIIVAPAIGVKYAIDSTKKGKKGKIFSGWLYELIMNVLLQTMHALIYTVIMSIAIDLATKSLFGYIIALVFINFILKADKIFMNIFNFKRSKTVGENAEPLISPKKQFATVFFVAGVTKDFIGGVWDLALWGEGKVRKAGRKVYENWSYRYDEKHGGDIKEEISDKKNDILNTIDNQYNNIYKKVMKKDNAYGALKVMSRRKDSIGRQARKQLKKAKQNRKVKFTAPFKFITSAGGNAIKVVLGVPMTVVNPGVGVGMVISGVTGTVKMATQVDNKGNKYKGKEALAQAATLGAYGTEKQIKKNDKKIGKAIKYLSDATKKEAEIERLFTKEFGAKLDKDAKRYKSEISYIMKYGNNENLNMILREKLNGRNILAVNDSNVDSVISAMAEDIFKSIGINGQYSDKMAKDIKAKMIEKAKDIYDKQKSDINKEYGASDMAHGFANAILENGITRDKHGKDTRELTNKFVELHEINRQAQDDIKSSVVKESEFIKSLNREKGSTDSES